MLPVTVTAFYRGWGANSVFNPAPDTDQDSDLWEIISPESASNKLPASVKMVLVTLFSSSFPTTGWACMQSEAGHGAGCVLGWVCVAAGNCHPHPHLGSAPPLPRPTPEACSSSFHVHMFLFPLSSLFGGVAAGCSLSLCVPGSDFVH
jgi:hypothetical protein